MNGSLTDVTDTWPGWSAIVETLLLRAGFNTTIVIVGTTLLGVAGGLVGAFSLLRKRALLADALSHATLPGIAGAFLVMVAFGGDSRSLPALLGGAALTGVLALLCVQLILRSTRLREDAALGIVLSVFFGVGIVLLSVAQSSPSGTQAGLSHFIYGQTAAMSRHDAILMGSIALLSILVAALLAKELALVCFNDAFAKVTGIPVTLLDLLLMGLVVLVTVTGLQAVGLILVVAILIIPAAAARFWTDRFRTMLLVAAIVGGISGYLGSVVSALLPRKPAGAVIVLVSGAVFAVSMLLAPRRGVVAIALRAARMRLRIAGEHLLSHLLEREEAAPAGTGSAMSNDVLVAGAGARGWSAARTRLVARLLAWRGLVQRRGASLALTPAGRAAGERVRRNHRLWEQYLVSYADVAPSHVDWSVDQVEHVLSESLVQELEASLEARGISASGRGRITVQRSDEER